MSKKRKNFTLNIVGDDSILEERVKGRTIREIALNENLSKEEAQQCLERALNILLETYALSPEQERALEVYRLDKWLNRLNGLIESGDIDAIRTANALSIRRSKLLGLDRQVQEQVRDRMASYLTRVNRAIERVLEPRQAQALKMEIMQTSPSGFIRDIRDRLNNLTDDN